MAPSEVSSSGSAGILGMVCKTGGEPQGRVSRRGRKCSMVQMCWCGQEAGELGTLEFSKDKVPGQQEHGKG